MPLTKRTTTPKSRKSGQINKKKRGKKLPCRHFIERMVGVVHVKLGAKIKFDASGDPDLMFHKWPMA